MFENRPLSWKALSLAPRGATLTEETSAPYPTGTPYGEREAAFGVYKLSADGHR
ncbi:hypothetical protein ACF3DV_00255 [Chlorogloeopsis fritschii PCC 9212]|uniref:hypothetical protein n=1 Tax=Chlorogloeopsis fritschii TaxID=1124 RepID=UPI0002D59C25|nr:hypothetical protein [Chlorogloeopsis fritschii]